MRKEQKTRREGRERLTSRVSAQAHVLWHTTARFHTALLSQLLRTERGVVPPAIVFFFEYRLSDMPSSQSRKSKR